MFSQNKLAQLYPHLNLSRTMAPSVKASLQPKEEPKPEPVSKRSISIERPKRQQTPQPPEKRVKSPSPPKEPVTPKQVKIDEPPKEEVKVIEETIPEVVQKPQVKKAPRPNRIKPEPKPEPVRESQVPKKGERGLQRKYTLEQRRQMYIDRLSRKSVKNAEKEVEAVTEVLEKAGGTGEGLVRAEKAIRGQLRLINYAKYFCQSDDLTNTTNNEVNEVSEEEEETENED